MADSWGGLFPHSLASIGVYGAYRASQRMGGRTPGGTRALERSLQVREAEQHNRRVLSLLSTVSDWATTHWTSPPEQPTPSTKVKKR